MWKYRGPNLHLVLIISVQFENQVERAGELSSDFAIRNSIKLSATHSIRAAVCKLTPFTIALE